MKEQKPHIGLRYGPEAALENLLRGRGVGA
jgi:hypothetical protein